MLNIVTNFSFFLKQSGWLVNTFGPAFHSNATFANTQSLASCSITVAIGAILTASVFHGKVSSSLTWQSIQQLKYYA